MTTYRANVYRDGKWWMIDVPELDGLTRPDGTTNVSSLTQARHYSEIEQQARDFICTAADVAPSTIDLDLHITVDGLDVIATAEKIAADRKAAADAEARALSTAKETAKKLRAAGVSLSDIGSVIGVSLQRVSQIV